MALKSLAIPLSDEEGAWVEEGVVVVLWAKGVVLVVVVSEIGGVRDGVCGGVVCGGVDPGGARALGLLGSGIQQPRFPSAGTTTVSVACWGGGRRLAERWLWRKRQTLLLWSTARATTTAITNLNPTAHHQHFPSDQQPS